MEQAILSQYRRLPGFHSEFVGLEVMGSHIDSIGFEDILNGEPPFPWPKKRAARGAFWTAWGVENACSWLGIVQPMFVHPPDLLPLALFRPSGCDDGP